MRMAQSITNPDNIHSETNQLKFLVSFVPQHFFFFQLQEMLVEIFPGRSISYLPDSFLFWKVTDQYHFAGHSEEQEKRSDPQFCHVALASHLPLNQTVFRLTHTGQ